LSADFPSAGFESCDDFVLYTKIQRLSNKFKLLKRKGKASDIQAFRDTQFLKPEKVFPEPEDKEVNRLLLNTKAILNENKELKREIDFVDDTNENLVLQVSHAEKKIECLESLLELTNSKYKKALHCKTESAQLRQQLNDWESKYENLSQQYDNAVEELHEKQNKLNKQSTRNLNKKIKRRDECIKKTADIVREKEKEISEKEREIIGVKGDNEKMVCEVSELKREKRNLLLKVSRLKNKCNDFYDKNAEKIDSLKLEIEEKNKYISELQQLNALLDTESPLIETFYNGKFSDEVRETIMVLVTECGVSQTKVNNVMATVIKNLTGKTLSRLPSTGVKSRLLI
jgi:chromosome segregation ATPase